jgi:hypothetical protein
MPGRIDVRVDGVNNPTHTLRTQSKNAGRSTPIRADLHNHTPPMRQVIEVPGFTHHDLPYNLIVNLQHTRSPRRQTHAEPPEKLSYHAVWTGNRIGFHTGFEYRPNP